MFLRLIGSLWLSVLATPLATAQTSFLPQPFPDYAQGGQTFAAKTVTHKIPAQSPLDDDQYLSSGHLLRLTSDGRVARGPDMGFIGDQGEEKLDLLLSPDGAYVLGTHFDDQTEYVAYIVDVETGRSDVGGSDNIWESTVIDSCQADEIIRHFLTGRWDDTDSVPFEAGDSWRVTTFSIVDEINNYIRGVGWRGARDAVFRIGYTLKIAIEFRKPARYPNLVWNPWWPMTYNASDPEFYWMEGHLVVSQQPDGSWKGDLCTVAGDPSDPVPPQSVDIKPGAIIPGLLIDGQRVNTSPPLGVLTEVSGPFNFNAGPKLPVIEPILPVRPIPVPLRPSIGDQ